MKIAINAASAKMGGAVKYLTHLLHLLPPPQSGYRFFVFLPSDTAKLLQNVPGNITLCELPRKAADGWRRLRWEQFTLRRFLRAENIDALFSTANFAMLRCPVKQVLLVRNALYFSKMYREMFLGKHTLRFRLTFALRRWMILQSVRSADVVMTPTQAMLDDLSQSGQLDRRKALVNYYGADRQDGPAGSAVIQSEAKSLCSSHLGSSGAFSSRGGQGEGVPPHTAPPGVESGVIRLAYVSLYSEHKNLGTLLRAISLLNRNGGAKFVLRTTVDPAWPEAAWTLTHKDDLALTRQDDIAPWVEFVGPLRSEQIEELYTESDICVFPSLCESFGHPMLEAMAHGLPIVAADTPVNREMCGDAAIYFSPLNPKDIKDKIVVLGRDRALRQNLCIASRARAAAYFRWEHHVDRLLQAL